MPSVGFLVLFIQTTIKHARRKFSAEYPLNTAARPWVDPTRAHLNTTQHEHIIEVRSIIHLVNSSLISSFSLYILQVYTIEGIKLGLVRLGS